MKIILTSLAVIFGRLLWQHGGGVGVQDNRMVILG